MSFLDDPDVAALAQELSFAIDGHTNPTHMLLAAAALRGGLVHARNDEWPTSARTLEADGIDLLLSARGADEWVGLVRIGRVLGRVVIESGTVYASIAAGAPEELTPALESLRSAIPDRRALNHGDQVCFQIWREGRYGNPEDELRVLRAHEWDRIAPNYGTATRDALERLAAMRPPAEDEGRALIWHGEPGTGKTYALRAISRAWREWCDVHVVADAERFLASATYMDEVLDFRSAEERWRLIALEDTGELLTADARERVGQGLSRLLNATDGLIGQGTRALVLVTTNEPLVRLHPAMSRPGRCLANVEFTPLAAQEANAWLAERGSERVDRPTTIAELYEIARGCQPTRRRSPNGIQVGFAASRAA